jgi:hypothetical protein
VRIPKVTITPVVCPNFGLLIAKYDSTMKKIKRIPRSIMKNI